MLVTSLHRNLDSLITLVKNVELRFPFIGITQRLGFGIHRFIPIFQVIILSTILVKIEQVEVLVYI